MVTLGSAFQPQSASSASVHHHSSIKYLWYNCLFELFGCLETKSYCFVCTVITKFKQKNVIQYCTMNWPVDPLFGICFLFNFKRLTLICLFCFLFLGLIVKVYNQSNDVTSFRQLVNIIQGLLLNNIDVSSEHSLPSLFLLPISFFFLQVHFERRIEKRIVGNESANLVQLEP